MAAVKRFLSFDVQGTSAGNLADANAFITSINTALGYTGLTTAYATPSAYSGIANSYRVEIKDDIYNMLTSAQRAKVYEDFKTQASLIVPANYQAYQKTPGGSTGTIVVTGNYNGINSKAIEANYSPTGSSYTQLTANQENGDISLSLPSQSSGQGILTLRQTADPANLLSFANVAVTDIFGLIGQSNMNEQGVSRTSTGKALVFNKSTRRSKWSTMDGTDGVTNAGWPVFADSYAASQGGQTAFVAPAVGGTKAEEWQKTATYSYPVDSNNPFGAGLNLYNRALQMFLLAGCGWPLIWLWHQGEANVKAPGASGATTKDEYKTLLRQLGDDLFADTGRKLMAAKMEQTKGEDGVLRDISMVNTAIAELWAEGGNILQGPDFSDLTPGQNEAGFGYVHFKTSAEQNTQWSRWWTAVKTYQGWA